MNFQIVHTTTYEYSAPAIESYSELRVRPRNTLRQIVSHHATDVSPRVPMETFVDYYGNIGESLSVPFRHRKLVVTSRSLVETRPYQDALSGLDLTISEAVHLAWPQRREIYDFTVPSVHTPFLPEIEDLARECLPGRAPFAESVLNLNRYLFESFKYRPGVTDVSTPISEVIATGQGVCQDFAHVMIAVLRAGGIPARYVSGYIETDSEAAESERRAAGFQANGNGNGASNGAVEPSTADGLPRLIGATASHAWVEIYTPNGYWVGLDPTNNILEGERHVQIGIGRDYADVPPLRGVFKGAERQRLSVKVKVFRRGSAPAEEPETEGLPLFEEA